MFGRAPPVSTVTPCQMAYAVFVAPLSDPSRKAARVLPMSVECAEALVMAPGAVAQLEGKWISDTAAMGSSGVSGTATVNTVEGPVPVVFTCLETAAILSAPPRFGSAM